MVRRKRRRNISTTLTEARADNLVGGVMYKLLSKRAAVLFDSDLQRRAVYFANREKLINQAVDIIGPGCRPAGFWEYEHKAAGVIIDDSRERPGLKYLIENNLLLPGELEEVTADIIQLLEGPAKQYSYRELEQQAKALKGPALEAWHNLNKADQS